MTAIGNKRSLHKLDEGPKGWGWTTLGTIADIRLGKMLSPKAYDTDLIQLPYLRNQNIRWGSIDFADVKRMGFRKEEVERYGLVPGDLLVCEGGAAGRCAVYAGSPSEFLYQKALHRVRPIELLANSYFLQFCLQHYVASGTVLPRLSETTIQHLPLEKIRELRILLPPLAEQRRIVAEIEKQFTMLHAAVEALKRVRAKLKRYRASVLKAACEGRLVPTEAKLARAEGRDYEPADLLLQRILKERRSKWEAEELSKMRSQGRTPANDLWKSRYRQPLTHDAVVLPQLAEGWVWATVGSISTKVVDGVHKKPNYVSNGIPFVTVRNLTAGPGVSFERLNYITPNDHLDFVKRANPEKGDLLVSKDGTLGVIRVIKTDLAFSIFVSVALIKPVLRPMSAYLGVALSSPQVQIQMVPKGSGLQHIHLEDLRADCLPLPPLAEQHRIVAEVELRLSLIEELEAVAEANLKRAERLRQSILKRAFEGKLVAQDPTDEPASVLLERICTERAAEGESPASRKHSSRTKRRRA